MKTKAFLVLGAIALLTAISSFAAYTPYERTVTIAMDPWEPSPRLTEKLTRACAEGTRDVAFAEVCKEFHVQLAQAPTDRPSGYTPNPERPGSACPAVPSCTAFCRNGKQLCNLVNSCTGEIASDVGFTRRCADDLPIDPTPIPLPVPVPSVDPRVQRRTPTPIQIQPGRGMGVPGLPNVR